jgi:hypothetical protein
VIQDSLRPQEVRIPRALGEYQFRAKSDPTHQAKGKVDEEERDGFIFYAP